MAKRRDPLLFLDSYGALKRCLDALCTEAYSASDLSAAEGRILRYVAENPGTSQADLARATCSDAALTGRALQPLLDRGWIERRRSDEDRREYVLSLATVGRPALKRVAQVRATLAMHVAKRLDQQDLLDFDRIVEKLSAETLAKPPQSAPRAKTVKRR